MPSSPAYDIAAWRKQIPLLASCIPMNNCSQAPQTDATRAAADRYLDSWNTIGMDWDAWMREVALAKAEFAKLINASPDEIAVFSSVSEAASAVASAIDFGAKRRSVLASEMEFPTVGHVWLAQQPRGAELNWVPVANGTIAAADYESRITNGTAIVSACHGFYLNGFIQDLGRIAKAAHAHGALLFADAYQTLGAVPVTLPVMVRLLIESFARILPLAIPVPELTETPTVIVPMVPSDQTPPLRGPSLPTIEPPMSTLPM